MINIPLILQKEQIKFCRIRNGTKRPFEKDWVNKTYSYEEISRFQNENYGIVCGYGNLAVIDCDKEELSLAVKTMLPKTFTIKTGGGGTHYYYFIPELKKKVILNAGEDHLGEIQSYGSQVVGPGSIHPNGNEYKLIEDIPMATITMDDLKKVLGSFMFKEREEITQTSGEETKDYKDLINEIVKVWKEGNRQELALSVAGYLRKEKRLGINKAKQIITEVCRICKDEELEMRLRAVIETFKKDEKDIKGIKSLQEHKIKTEKIDRSVFLVSKGINKKTNKEEFSVNVDKVADYLMEKHNFKTWFGVKSDYCFNWNGKIFERNSRGIVKEDCERLLKNYSRRNITDEIYDKIKSKTKIDREEFEKTDINLIPLENGIWNINERKLIPHDPKYNFKFLIPQTYNQEAKCPKWDKFVNETLYVDDVKIMQEWFGFNLYREYFIKKGVICEGKQDTGKSVLLDTLIKFIGDKNKTGLSLQKITSGSDFTKLSLKEKHSNVFDDLSSKDLNDGGAFKVATGGGYISGEEKFGEFSQFRSFAKQMFATNKCPPVKDNDDLAYFGRWIVFKFDNVPDKLNPFLRTELWKAEEMSGILNWALEGLNRLLDKGKFSYNKTPEEVKNMMEESGIPLVSFSNNFLKKEDGSTITKDNMYKFYTAWCEVKHKPRLSKEMLGRQLKKYCDYIIPNQNKIRFWQNVVLFVTNTTSTTLLKIYREISKEEEGLSYRGNIILKKVVEVGTQKPLKDEPEYLANHDKFLNQDVKTKDLDIRRFE